MIFFCVIITALPTAALTKGSFSCNLSESNGAQQCFAVLDQPLTFYWPTNSLISARWKKDNVTILKIFNKNIQNPIKEYINRTALFTNATFILDSVTKGDSGDYQLEIYGLDGWLKHTVNFSLEILVPVSQPDVSQLCLSPEQMKVSCSSEGDGVEFILSLDSNVLIHARDGRTDQHHTPKVSNVTISLSSQLTGNLMCQAQNTVSSKDTVIHLTSCKGSVYHLFPLTVAKIMSATLLLPLVLFVCIKHLKARPATVYEDDTEEGIVCSDIKLRSTKKTTPNSNQNET